MKKYKIKIAGLVQGIGFRPTVVNIAKRLGIRGSVENIGGEILIFAETSNLNEFKNALFSIPKAKITSFSALEVDNFIEENRDFVIHSSEEGTPSIIAPDIGICCECLNSLENPFISCNICGARYTTIEKLPYDRENTTLKHFPMCNSCLEKYKNFGTRFGFAQGLVCEDCGLEIFYNDDTIQPIEKAISDVKSGKVIAIKGIGGYHFACDPFNKKSVEKLREIKGRETKPFAIMFKNIEEISKYCYLSDLEQEWILSDERPIVLLQMRKNYEENVDENGSFIACGVTNFEQSGCFIPSTGLEQILLNQLKCLIMTSANLSGQPIIFDDVEIKKFGVPVLWFNRKIARPIEDSVVRIIAEKPQIIRRAKGFAPLPVSLKTNKKILAMGGDLKACFAICDGENAFLSPYIGDLEERKTFDLYKKTLQEYFSLFDFFPEIIVCDLHPAYISTQYAENFSKEFGLPLEKVQHHKAHIASAMAEFNLENCIGVSYDGTGYGDDGNIWGGEIFSIKNNEFIRHWHFPYVKYLKGCEQDAQLVSFAHHPNFAPEIVRKALNCDINTYYSSSVGRLFDKFGFENYGFRYNSFEGEIANKIEQSAQYNNDVIDFFDKISEITAKQCNETFLKTGINNIVLTGGCFQNKILIEKIKENLYNFNIYINQKVPVNDGGICLGQAYIVRNL